MEVTKREILISVIIFCVFIALGLFIDYWIEESRILQKETYNKALKIENNNNLFKYAIETNVGNIIVNGELKVDKGVNHDWLKNDYLYINMITEEYTKHYRTVCVSCGKTTCCHRETYYSWDEIDSQKNSVSYVNFSGVMFDINAFTGYPIYRLTLNETTITNNKQNKISWDYIYENDLIFNRVGDKRYYFNVVDKSFQATIFGRTENNTIVDDNYLHINIMNINDFVDSKNNSYICLRVCFWIIWLVLCGFSIYKYVEMDNDYLEDYGGKNGTKF